MEGVITTLRFFVRQTGVSLIFGEADWTSSEHLPRRVQASQRSRVLGWDGISQPLANCAP